MDGWYSENEQRIPISGVRTRFAPSPTGYMHLGTLRTALYTYLIARSLKGKFILRIEDTDRMRLVDDSTEKIMDGIKECGLIYDEGPDIGGPCGPYIQSERREIYRQYAELLIEKGHAYRCFCARDDKEETVLDSDTVITKYDGRCSRLTQDEISAKLAQGLSYVIRQKIPNGGSVTFSDILFGEITVNNDELDDGVLIKADGLPTYNFANVIDDHLMGITHVVRGSEYLSSAPKYNLLYKAFGWNIPEYIHVSQIMRDARHKLSKRRGDPTFDDLLAEGYLRDAVINYVALLGWSPGGEREIFSLSELVEVFSISGLSKSPALFDKVKLNYFNSQYIKALTPEEWHNTALSQIEGTVGIGFDTGVIARLLQQRCEKLNDIPAQISFLKALPKYENGLFVNKKSKTTLESSLEMLNAVLPVLTALEDWSLDAVHDTLIGLAGRLEVKNAYLMWPVRIALSGQLVTPGGAVEICYLLGKNEALTRIQLAINALTAEL